MENNFSDDDASANQSDADTEAEQRIRQCGTEHPEKSTELRRNQMTQALTLSHEMLILAEEENWTDLANEQQQRDHLIQTALEEPIPEEIKMFAIQLIQHMQEYDEKIHTLISEKKNGAKQALEYLHRGKKMTAFYSSHHD